MLEHHHIWPSLLGYWKETFPQDWPTIYPGIQSDASQWTSWIELDIPFITEQNTRNTGLQISELMLDVHCFSKQDTNINRIHHIVDAARTTLSGQVIALRDFDLSAQPAIGYIKLAKAETRDLTRIEKSLLNRPLSHQLISTRALVQMIQ